MLFIGVTSDLVLRIWRHRSNAEPGFVQDYHVHRLVFAEFHQSMEAAILTKSGSRNGGARGSSN
jgi:putative endonuclease